MENKTFQLNEWKLAGFWPYTPFRYGAELHNVLDSQTGWIDAQVPGSVYADLERCGLIPEPFYEMNALSCEWVSNRWWVYQSEFELPEGFGAGYYRFLCKGIDYKATIYLNGEEIGKHEGMFLPFERDISSLVKTGGEKNHVVIILEAVPDEMGQIGYTSRTRTQRSRFYYKWDFSTRMVGVGLYDPVVVEYVPRAEMTQRHIRTDREGDLWSLSAEVAVASYQKCELTLRARLMDGDTLMGESECPVQGEGEQIAQTMIPDLTPELWWPNGYGEARLYRLELELWQKEQLLQRTTHPIGFRTVEYVQAEGRQDDSLPYQPVINGKRIYMKGANLVPMDMRQGVVDEDRYRSYLELCKKANINIVRLWGGGVIERDAFYSICDELGIMVWQEFIQSSSGLDCFPSTDPTFLALLKKVSASCIKYIRNHPSIVFFSGGNELFELLDGKIIPCRYSNPNISMLRSVVDELDGRTMMLPTSASGPNDVIYLDRLGLNHDVHGPWKFYVPLHYELFNGSDAILQSEFGCDGFSNYESLKKFLSPANLKVDTAKDNMVWRYHGEWWDTYCDRDRPLFGEFDRDDLQTLIKCNQFMQAEGIRYGLEANRCRAFKNCGTLIWQFNEPWPNVFCTCIVDYYAVPKMAYYAVKEAFAPRAVLLKYSHLLQTAGTAMTLDISIANDLEESDYQLSMRFVDHCGNLFREEILEGFVGENAVVQAGEIEIMIPESVSKGFTVETKLQIGGETVYKTYAFLTKTAEDEYYSREIPIARYDRMMGKDQGQ